MTRQVIEEVYQKDDTARLTEALREAEEKLLVFKQIEETLKLQHEQEINEIESKVLQMGYYELLKNYLYMLTFTIVYYRISSISFHKSMQLPILYTFNI